MLNASSKQPGLETDIVDYVAGIIYFGTFNRLLSHEIMRHSLDVKHRHLRLVGNHVLSQWKILRDHLSCELRVVFPQLETLMADAAANVTEHDTSCGDILGGKLEIVDGDATIPDAALAHSLSGHEGLPGFGVFWIVLAPFKDGQFGVVGKVEGRRGGRVFVPCLCQILGDGLVGGSHGHLAAQAC